MKKILLCITLILSLGIAFAASPKVDYTVRNAIYKYKAGNYTGCIQDLTDYVEKKPTALAYYYLGMSYTQAGITEKASSSYQMAAQLAQSENNPTLKKYAEIGKKKVESPEKFEDMNSYDAIKAVIDDKNKIPVDLQKDLKKKHLEYLRNEMNSNKTPNF